jgi:hypothetical protein
MKLGIQNALQYHTTYIQRTPTSDDRSSSASQNIYGLLRKQTVYCYVHTSSFTSTAPFASQMNPIHVLTPHISKIHEKIHAFSMVYTCTIQCSKPCSLYTFCLSTFYYKSWLSNCMSTPVSEIELLGASYVINVKYTWKYLYFHLCWKFIRYICVHFSNLMHVFQILLL